MNKMNILFTLLDLQPEGNNGGIYSDLAEEFVRKGHNVTVIAPALKGQSTGVYCERGMRILRVRTLDTTVVASTIKKGIALALMPYFFKIAYKRALKKEKFDVIFMPTPPITFIDLVKYIKEKTGAKFYLILRDIHPHSSRSIGMCNNQLMYNFLYNKAQKAYKEADFIGCMSPGNIDFVKSIAPKIDFDKIVLLPNWVNFNKYVEPNYDIRKKYNLENNIVVLFGGTIGVGQGVWNVVTLAEHYRQNKNVVFLVVGRGIRKQLLIDLAAKANLKNILFLDYMPRDEYQALLATADIGLISLDDRYKVPTCPSKVIGYMSQKIPVFAMINQGSDYGKFYIDEPHCGFWCEVLKKDEMFASFDNLLTNRELRKQMGEKGFQYYTTNFTTEKIYDIIIEQLK